MPQLITNANSAAGDSSLQTNLPCWQGSMQASAAITAKRVVAIGTDGRVATAATDGTASLTIGVAITAAAAANGIVQVVLGGIAENVPCSGTVAAGDLLKRNTTTAGWVQATATPAAGEVIGVAINGSSSNTVDVWVGAAKALS